MALFFLVILIQQQVAPLRLWELAMLRLMALALLRLLRLQKVVLQRLLHYCITTCKAEMDSRAVGRVGVIWCKASTITSIGVSAELVHKRTELYIFNKGPLQHWPPLRLRIA